MKKIILSFIFVFLSFGLVPHTLAAGVSCGGSTCTEGQTCETIGGVTGCKNSTSGSNSEAVQRSPSQNGFVPLAPIPGLTTPGGAVDSPNLANFFNALYKYLIGASVVLAIIMIMWGGMEISTQDSIGAHSEGRERITQAILGLIIVLSPVLVFSIINPAILNLSIGLKPLDIESGSTTPAPPKKAPPAAINQFKYGVVICTTASGNKNCVAESNACKGATMIEQVSVICVSGTNDTSRDPATYDFTKYSCPSDKYLAINCPQPPPK